MSWMSLQPGALGSLGFSWGDDQALGHHQGQGQVLGARGGGRWRALSLPAAEEPPHIMPACLIPAAGRQGVPVSPGSPRTQGMALGPSSRDVPRGAP